MLYTSTRHKQYDTDKVTSMTVTSQVPDAGRVVRSEPYNTTKPMLARPRGRAWMPEMAA